MTRNLTKRPVKRDPLQLALRLSITFALGGLLFVLIGSWTLAAACFGAGLACALAAEVWRRRRDRR